MRINFFNDDNIQDGNYLVAKRNDFIQKSRFSLTVTEFKLISFFISKIKPGDKPDTEYCISCCEFAELVGMNNVSYSFIKNTIKGLRDKSWWFETKPGVYTLMSWIEKPIVDTNKGFVTIKFDKDIIEFLFELQRQRRLDYEYFSSYEFKNIAYMKYKYSLRLYELFKSYQNKGRWIFEFGTGTINDIRNILADVDEKGNIKERKSWSEWKKFNQTVIGPAVKEINELTDLHIEYKGLKKTLQGVKTSKVSTIVFEISYRREPEFPVCEDIGLPLTYSVDTEESMQKTDNVPNVVSLA